jgi:hypothetical protein
MTSDAADRTGDRQFSIDWRHALGHLLNFILHGFVAADALAMVCVFVISERLIFVDGLGSFSSGQGVKIVTTGGHAAHDGLCTLPGVMAVVAGKNEMATMLEIHGGPFGLHRLRRLQGDDPQGNTHLFIPGNGNPQRDTGHNTDEQHHPHKR